KATPGHPAPCSSVASWASIRSAPPGPSVSISCAIRASRIGSARLPIIRCGGAADEVRVGKAARVGHHVLIAGDPAALSEVPDHGDSAERVGSLVAEREKHG